MNRRLLLAITIALAAAGCVRERAPAEDGAAPTGGEPPATAFRIRGAGERLRIAVVPKGTTHQFWQTIRAGAESAGREFNVQVLWNGPKSETDIQDQIDIINNFANQGVDGICLAATDRRSLVAPVEALMRRGIPVIVIDSGIDADVALSFIATDNVAAARQGAETLGRLLNGQGKVAVMPFLRGAGTSDEREQGCLAGLAAFPGITAFSTDHTNSDSAEAQKVMETLLAQHPDLAGVFACNEPNVVGVASVLKTRGLDGRVKVVGFDASPAEIDYLRAGVVQALVVQNPFRMGYEGVKQLAQTLRGGNPPPKRIDTGATIATRENMGDPEVRKLLFPLESR